MADGNANNDDIVRLVSYNHVVGSNQYKIFEVYCRLMYDSIVPIG